MRKRRIQLEKIGKTKTIKESVRFDYMNTIFETLPDQMLSW